MLFVTAVRDVASEEDLNLDFVFRGAVLTMAVLGAPLYEW